MFSPPSMFNFPEVKSPTRNKPIVLSMPKSPFCTTPSQLEDVTNDDFSLNSRTAREPFGGRSIKEVGDHLNSLRKENFNLKLRIFFLEENLGPGFNNEETLKTNVNLKIEIESLKKELQEKKELLCQAVKAIEVEEEEHKRFTEEKKKELEELRQQLDVLQKRPSHLHGDTIDLGSDEETIELITENERLRADLLHKDALNSDLQNSVERYKAQVLKQSFQIEEYRSLIEAKDVKIAALESAQKMKKPENGDADTHRPPLRSLSSPNGAHSEKIAKLEQEQMKACKIIKTMLEARKKNQAEMEELKKTLERKDEEILELKEKVKGIARKVKTPGRRQSGESSSDVERTMVDEMTREDHEELLEQYKALTQELDTQKQILLDTLKEKDAQMESLQQSFSRALDDLKERDNRIVDLEFELIGRDSNEKLDSGTEKEEKDREIERLEKELSKKTCDLQTIVNKELWEKNREIEKLQKKFSTLMEVKEAEVKHAKEEINKKEEDFAKKMRDVETKYEKEIAMMHTNLKCFVDDRKKLLLQIEEMKKEYAKGEECENLRFESNEICSVLSTRLEEIALFLDSLLKQKSVLGFLGNKQNDRLRQFVDKSLDLSRTLNATLSMNPEESLMQLSNISELLNSTKNDSLCIEQILGKNNEHEEETHLSIIPDNITLTYQNHLHVKNAHKMAEQAEIIKVLRNQVENLKREIEVRDNEIAIKGTRISDLESKTRVLSPERILENLMSDKLKFNTPQKCHETDSESWSEPDRSVSKARIGLQDNESLKPRMKSCVKSESSEVEFNMKLSKASKRGMMQQIIELQEKLRVKEEELFGLQRMHGDLVERFKALEVKSNEDKAKFNEIANSHEEFLVKIEKIEESLSQAEERRENAENQVVRLRKTIEELEASKRNLLESIEVKSKDVQNKVNVLEVERNRALKAKDSAEEELQAAKGLIKMAEKRAAVVEKELLELKKHSEAKIREIEEGYEKKLKQIEHNAESRIKIITESSNELLRKYETEYVKKNEMDRLVNMVSELETLREVLKVYETRVRALESNENNMKAKMQETEVHYREKLSEVRKQLDAANLHYSEVVLQKTKVEEEKIKLVYDMKLYKDREEDFVKQVSELKEEFGNLREKFQKQVTSTEDQKSKLLVKISELETANAELLNRLIKRSTGYDDFNNHAKSAPNSPTSKILNMYLARNPEGHLRKDSESSIGFISESHTMTLFRNPSGGDDGIMEMERMHANSSPDLGIESDHGRFSSLEANVNVPRPYLQPLELSQSMTHMLDREQQSQLVECGKQHCCTKAEENAHLRKKLQKSNKLLEETIKKLAKANDRKREVERNICNQITKTSLVLRKAKANLDSGSESDFRK